MINEITVRANADMFVASINGGNTVVMTRNKKRRPIAFALCALRTATWGAIIVYIVHLL